MSDIKASVSRRVDRLTFVPILQWNDLMQEIVPRPEMVATFLGKVAAPPAQLPKLFEDPALERRRFIKFWVQPMVVRAYICSSTRGMLSSCSCSCCRWRRASSLDRSYHAARATPCCQVGLKSGVRLRFNTGSLTLVISPDAALHLET